MLSGVLSDGTAYPAACMATGAGKGVRSAPAVCRAVGQLSQLSAEDRGQTEGGGRGAAGCCLRYWPHRHSPCESSVALLRSRHVSGRLSAPSALHILLACCCGLPWQVPGRQSTLQQHSARRARITLYRCRSCKLCSGGSCMTVHRCR